MLDKTRLSADIDKTGNAKPVGASGWAELEQILKQDKQSLLFELVRSFSNAFVGIQETFLSERNFRIQVGAAVLALAAAVILKISVFNWLILIQVIALVLTAELINTALERLVDLATDGLYHPLARAAKDIAAGAVLMASIFAVASGLFIFGPYVFRFL